MQAQGTEEAVFEALNSEAAANATAGLQNFFSTTVPLLISAEGAHSFRSHKKTKKDPMNKRSASDGAVGLQPPYEQHLQ